MVRVEMYTTPTCASCRRAKRLLEQRGATVDEIDVSFDRTPMIERTGGRHTVPQIFVGETHVGGFEDLLEVDRDGSLDVMLAG
jgi:glutaredoxin 3